MRARGWTLHQKYLHGVCAAGLFCGPVECMDMPKNKRECPSDCIGREICFFRLPAAFHCELKLFLTGTLYVVLL